jgi:hydroxyacylglutathione hydrolase
VFYGHTVFNQIFTQDPLLSQISFLGLSKKTLIFHFNTFSSAYLMLVEIFTVGMLQTNCYVASCEQTKEAIIIDPGLDFMPEAQPIFNYIDKEKLKIKYIVNTHGHSDHVKGDAIMQKKYAAPICIHGSDASFLEELEKHNIPSDVLLKDGDSIKFGNNSLKVLHTPGHTMGSICLIGGKFMFSGDTLFAGSIGRTDFLESSPKDMEATLHKLLELPDCLLVYPGHGELSLMGQEKRSNPFLEDL